MLKELSCVTAGHVSDWCKANNIGEDEVEWDQQSKYIFKINNWDQHDCKSMAEVEHALKVFIDNLKQNERIYV
jgi:hypothetical protein